MSFLTWKFAMRFQNILEKIINQGHVYLHQALVVLSRAYETQCIHSRIHL